MSASAASPTTRLTAAHRRHPRVVLYPLALLWVLKRVVGRGWRVLGKRLGVCNPLQSKNLPAVRVDGGPRHGIAVLVFRARADEDQGVEPDEHLELKPVSLSESATARHRDELVHPISKMRRLGGRRSR